MRGSTSREPRARHQETNNQTSLTKFSHHFYNNSSNPITGLYAYDFYFDAFYFPYNSILLRCSYLYLIFVSFYLLYNDFWYNKSKISFWSLFFIKKSLILQRKSPIIIPINNGLSVVVVLMTRKIHIKKGKLIQIKGRDHLKMTILTTLTMYF
jgi:hypothetical protein